MSHWLHPKAEEELGDAAEYYANRASLTIALAFLAEYERVRDMIVANQKCGSLFEGGLRAFQFDRFPYTLIYEEDPDQGPQIYAVAHQRREPGYWRNGPRPEDRGP